jgi:hypothetical protein
MKTIAVVALVTAMSAIDALGEPAAPPAPGLAEIMMATQTRHSKLWLAGNARNWDLADYQIDELKEGLEDAVKLVPNYKGVPVGSMIENLMMTPIGEVETAIKERDRTKFAAAFEKLTAACNSCHQGSNRGFIVIQRPATSSFPNQSFAPKRK